MCTVRADWWFSCFVRLAVLLAARRFFFFLYKGAIPGTRNPDHLTENLGAVYIELTADDLRQIDAELSKIKVHGGRMNGMQMQAVDEA